MSKALSRFVASAGESTKKRTRKTGQSKLLRFGNVTISGDKPNKSAVSANVEMSAAALKRVSKVIIRPGVALRMRRNVPQYWASDDQVDVFFRKLNGKIEMGRLVDGAFRVFK